MKEKFDFYNSTTIKSYNLNEKIRYQLKMLDGLDNVTRKHSENVANLTCRMCEVLHKNLHPYSYKKIKSDLFFNISLLSNILFFFL
jgi:repressor of nif and glnA expression